MVYSLTEAAKAAGRTRQALQAAIKKGTISAKKDAFGQWEIDPAELHRVYPLQKEVAANDPQDLLLAAAEKEAQIRELRARLEVMEQLAEELRGQRDKWMVEADEWRMQAKALPSPETSA